MPKRYYWLKLKEDFFDEDTIEWLEEQENGLEYSHFYLKLCLKSLRTNGELIRSVGNIFIPYDAKKLSEITKTDIDTVKVAMDLFKKIGLIDILDGGVIKLNQLSELVGSETISHAQDRFLKLLQNHQQPIHRLSLENHGCSLFLSLLLFLYLYLSLTLYAVTLR